MSRRSTALHTWALPDRPLGDVRLLAPAAGKRSYRLVWRTEEGQRERTTTDWARAHALGLEIAQSLADAADAARPAAPAPGRPLAAALDYYLDAEARGVRWSEKYRRRLRGLVGRWLTGDLLATPCREFAGPPGRARVLEVLDVLETRGYGHGTHEYECLGAMLSGLFRTGVAAGYFADNPMAGVGYSIAGTRGERGRRFANVVPVPTEASPPSPRVDEFLAACPGPRGRWWEGLTVAVMAYGGLRLEEALALTPDQVLTDPATPGIRVTQQLYELRASENHGTAAIVLRKPKGGRIRETFVPPDVWRALVRRAEEVRAAHAPGAGGAAPMFPAPRGGWQWTSNWRRDVFLPAAERVGWPLRPPADPTARRSDEDPNRPRPRREWQWSPHSFRHHFANWCLKDLALAPTVVAGYLGHASADITERMYLHRERSDLGRGLLAYTRAAAS